MREKERESAPFRSLRSAGCNICFCCSLSLVATIFLSQFWEFFLVWKAALKIRLKKSKRVVEDASKKERKL